MEYIEFRYVFNDDDGDVATKEVRISKKDDAITSTDACEMFLDFMESAGYSVENVIEWFNE